jgi:Ca2+/Na+ antiporter
MSSAWPLAQFVVCALLIARAGHALSRSADALADAHGWGRGWVGLALLATVTSLPELASGISAVAVVDAPNLAVGNVLGACVVNLLFLVVVDALQRRQPMYREASATHLLSAGFGVVMLGFVALSLITGQRAPSVTHVGVYSPLLLAMLLSEDHRAVQDAVRAYVQAEIAPHAARLGQEPPVPEGRAAGLADLGCYGVAVPTEWDGAGLDYLALAVILEEIAAGDGATSTVVSVNNCPVCSILMAFGNDEQKERFLKPLARGDMLGAFCLTEPHVGSEAGG